MNFHFIERIMQNYPRKVITFKTFSPLCIQYRFEKVERCGPFDCKGWDIKNKNLYSSNEFRLGKLENKVQTYLALLQASLLGSFQRMFLALHVCCRYPEVVIWSLH